MAEKLTKADIKKIEAEIEMRKLELRPKLIEAVKEARAQGDLSENFEYYAAKREKNQNESRINYLERMIKFANIVEDKAKSDEVGLGKIVKVYYIDDEEEENRLSIESPIGKALLGHKVGDIVHINLSSSSGYDLKILEIRIDDTDYNIRSF